MRMWTLRMNLNNRKKQCNNFGSLDRDRRCCGCPTRARDSFFPPPLPSPSRLTSLLRVLRPSSGRTSPWRASGSPRRNPPLGKSTGAATRSRDRDSHTMREKALFRQLFDHFSAVSSHNSIIILQNLIGNIGAFKNKRL